MSSTKTVIDFGDSFNTKGIMSKVNSPAIKDWISKRRQSVQPWSDFINTNKFRKPVSMSQWSKRAVKNVELYQSNYVFVFAGLILYCVITSPLLLIAIAAFLAACYAIHARNENTKLKIFGYELSYAQQYGAAACLSFPLFFLAGAGAAVFWVLGVSFFLITLHASFHISSEEGAAEDEQPFVDTV